MDELDRNYNYQSALTEQQIAAQREINAMQMQENKQVVQAALIEQTNPLRVLEDIELKLKGKRKDYTGQVISWGEPIMNEMGINRMIFILSSVVNQNTILSHLEDKEINRLIIKIGDDIIDDLTLNWEIYGIKDKILLDYVVDALVIPSFMSLKRALEQNEKNWLNKTVVESITSSPRMPMQNKESFLSRFKP